ncbi:hypothetical protein [Halobacillus litoralis]|uniref:hypothetical protein n=1 Tax=Halobacillus litoralis TaxID=45668 RepID=UPI0013E8CBA8|nr:hypothetical protein [Halobacillus litoralis]
MIFSIRLILTVNIAAGSCTRRVIFFYKSKNITLFRWTSLLPREAIREKQQQTLTAPLD